VHEVDTLGTRALIFDGDCGFCTSAARFARRRLPEDVRVVPWQFVEDPSAMGLTQESIAEAVWWVDAHRDPHRGHQAFAEGAAAFRGPWSIAGRISRSLFRVPMLDELGARAYTVLARNRSRLPGSTPACQLPRARRDEHHT
jgi:predicted DCC family thiol-disulfide oxidoreductase YuxK